VNGGDVCACETASEEQHDCIPNRPRGRIDVPPYNQMVTDSVTEDWDTGMNMLR